MLFTYAIKGEEKILVTSENRDLLVGYKFVQEENPILEVKLKCKNDILEKYSETDQTNMMARVGEINSLCLLEKRDPTEEEKENLENARTMVTWIRTRKAQCAADIKKLLTTNTPK